MATSRVDVPNVLAGDAVVVYSVSTGVIRYIASSTRDRDIPSVELRDGEGVLHVPQSAARDIPALVERVRQITGRAESGRCAVVNNGIVIDTIVADPFCGDAIPGCLLIATDEAGIGWSYDGFRFSPPPPTEADMRVRNRAVAR